MLRTPQEKSGNRACVMKPSAAVSAAILRIEFAGTNLVNLGTSSGYKKYPDLVSTRSRIHIGLKNIHSGERTQKVPDLPANSTDTCGRKAYPERKSCITLFKNTRIREDGA